MIRCLLAAALLAAPAAAQEPDRRSPNEIVAVRRRRGEWVVHRALDLLVMTLAPDAAARADGRW
jgi:hypothetical protein